MLSLLSVGILAVSRTALLVPSDLPVPTLFCSQMAITQMLDHGNVYVVRCLIHVSTSVRVHKSRDTSYCASSSATTFKANHISRVKTEEFVVGKTKSYMVQRRVRVCVCDER